MIDHLLVAALVACTLGLGTACWYVLAMPEIFVSLWEQEDEGWLDGSHAGVAALRWITAALLLVMAFGSCFALVFLASTSP